PRVDVRESCRKVRAVARRGPVAVGPPSTGRGTPLAASAGVARYRRGASDDAPTSPAPVCRRRARAAHLGADAARAPRPAPSRLPEEGGRARARHPAGELAARAPAPRGAAAAARPGRAGLEPRVLLSRLVAAAGEPAERATGRGHQRQLRRPRGAAT